MIEYYVARAVVDDEPGFTVAKFDGKDVPERVYSMTIRHMKCDCLSPHNPCKHARLVQCWMDEGEPVTPMVLETVKVSSRKRYTVTL